MIIAQPSSLAMRRIMSGIMANLMNARAGPNSPSSPAGGAAMIVRPSGVRQRSRHTRITRGRSSRSWTMLS